MCEHKNLRAKNLRAKLLRIKRHQQVVRPLLLVVRPLLLVVVPVIQRPALRMPLLCWAMSVTLRRLALTPGPGSSLQRAKTSTGHLKRALAALRILSSKGWVARLGL